MEGNVAAEVSFLLPEDQVCNFERFFTDLEREQDTLGVETYGLSITTLEEVCRLTVLKRYMCVRHSRQVPRS